MIDFNKPRMLSGIKPTGNLTLGNYLGAIKQFVKYQDEYQLFVFVADLHALTVYNDPEELHKNILKIIATYRAAGLDPKKTVIFRQSDIPAHNQLEWVLTCNTLLRDLTKMPQYKNYLDKHKNEATPSGMLLYPSLMNADILLYDARYVPVGIDQKPHIELTRDIAETFNKRYGEVFVLPDPIVTSSAAKIMSLSDPTKKMSKSESDKGTIYLDDDPETIKYKIMKSKTDGDSLIYIDAENKPGITNLLAIYAACKNIPIGEAYTIFKDEKDYRIFKQEVAEAVISELSPIQNRIEAYMSDAQSDLAFPELGTGAMIAQEISNRKINEVYDKIGLRKPGDALWKMW